MTFHEKLVALCLFTLQAITSLMRPKGNSNSLQNSSKNLLLQLQLELQMKQFDVVYVEHFKHTRNLKQNTMVLDNKLVTRKSNTPPLISQPNQKITHPISSSIKTYNPRRQNHDFR